MQKTKLPNGQEVYGGRYLKTGDDTYRDMSLFMKAQESKRRLAEQAKARAEREAAKKKEDSDGTA